jgi:hypothetical protein
MLNGVLAIGAGIEATSMVAVVDRVTQVAIAKRRGTAVAGFQEYGITFLAIIGKRNAKKSPSLTLRETCAVSNRFRN